jgi:hypothetical protein
MISVLEISGLTFEGSIMVKPAEDPKIILPSFVFADTLSRN